MVSKRPAGDIGSVRGNLNQGENQAHYLKPTTSTKIPRSIVFVDTEAYQIDGPKAGQKTLTFRLGVAVHVRREAGEWTRRKVCRFTTREEFWTWLDERMSPRAPLWVFGHNIGFDLTMLRLWDRIDDGVYNMGLKVPKRRRRKKGDKKVRRPWQGCFIASDPPTIISLQSDLGKVRFIDSFNYIKESIADMGEALELPKMALPVESADDAEWFQRCERDVEILERTLCGYMANWETLDCGIWQETAAGLSFAAFRRTIKPKTIVIDHSPDHTRVARAAYYGGQAEAYYLGPIGPPIIDPDAFGDEIDPSALPTGPVYLLDVRNCYPSVMRDNWFPVEHHATQMKPLKRQVERRLRQQLPIASVVIDSKTRTYPYRATPDEPTRYVTGLFRTFLAGPELAYALWKGDVQEVHEVHWYVPGRPFKAFVEKYYAERVSAEQREDAPAARFYKLLLDSLSGKWGQHKLLWESRPGHVAAQRWGEWRQRHAQKGTAGRFRAIAGLVQEYGKGGEGREAYTPIAAFITSYARQLMRGLRDSCPAFSVLYQDTDSLIVTQAGFNALLAADKIVPGMIGALQIKQSAMYAGIAGVKFYGFGDTWKIAGIKDSAVIVNPGVFEQESWPGLGELLGCNPCGAVTVATVQRDLSRGGCFRDGRELGWQVPPNLVEPLRIPF